LDIIYDFFTPFFVIGVGLGIRLGSLTPALWSSAVLILAAFAGKFFGSSGPAMVCQSHKPVALLGLNMISRVEVVMIITQRSRNLTNNVMPDYIFKTMVITCLMSCTVQPMIPKRAIPQWSKVYNRMCFFDIQCGRKHTPSKNA
jgi:Kef-type K+ transport system membrane component KefB